MLYFYLRIGFDVLKVQYHDQQFAYIRIGLIYLIEQFKILADNRI